MRKQLLTTGVVARMRILPQQPPLYLALKTFTTNNYTAPSIQIVVT